MSVQELVGDLEFGSGSTYFVHEKLAPLLALDPKPIFTGAIILDSIMNYNASQDSQVLPNLYEAVQDGPQQKLLLQQLFSIYFLDRSLFQRRTITS